MALLIVGGYYAYQNRFKIMQFLEARGVKVPSDTSDLKNTILSGVSKIRGRAENLAGRVDEEARKAI
ncbi:MAG: hypothetical protein ACXWPM_08965 [Bdellovibrionota bacterium]